MDSSPPRRPSAAQVLLGVFILWQLFFLFTYNYLQLSLGPPDWTEEDRRKGRSGGPPGPAERMVAVRLSRAPDAFPGVATALARPGSTAGAAGVVIRAG
jgi:hypothetical protein